jgi:hypothetical protein
VDETDKDDEWLPGDEDESSEDDEYCGDDPFLLPNNSDSE